MNKKKTQIISLAVLAILMVALPLLFTASQKVQQLLTRASGTPANITINTETNLGPLSTNWNSFAQGGESSDNMILPAVAQLKTLNPKHIRIDHIYDHYNVVSRLDNGQLSFNFTQLDAMITSILQTGATPLISLSYMPSVIAEGDIVSKPRDWNEWKLVVQRTIEHYSGKSDRNISDVYYEVWNEPDLFGKWKTYGDKNYLILYSYAARGAMDAQNTNSFKFGGPATTQLYTSWITALAKMVTQSKLKLDFFSWHRYSRDPLQFAKDRKDITTALFLPFPSLVGVERIISEWGFDPEINAGYDTNFAAAHTVATVRQVVDGGEQLYAFEPIDGLDPAGKQFWGRWGLMTHPSKGLVKKPRYLAFQLLNQMKGNRLSLVGEGTWVTGFAAKDADTIKIMLSNYDPASRHIESTPLTVTNLINGNYALHRSRPGENTVQDTIDITDQTYSTSVVMLQNTITMLELTLTAAATPSATPSPGPSATPTLPI